MYVVLVGLGGMVDLGGKMVVESSIVMGSLSIQVERTKGRER